ncbi:protein-tyrosine phosphatase family protein [Aliiroseovarius sp. 2305UL8-7]|uniref:protein-tyrosine phosphatase family protein n=1 Tax=Aliiroseovarius conchicola TaxID=3121637 RepID=UPI0035275718
MREAFSISELKAGHGWLGICPLPGRWGTFNDDLTAVLIWRPTLVLSMTETPEMVAHGAKDFGNLLKQAGIEWRHFPIKDFGAPPAEALDVWPEISEAARRALRNGGKVLAHCKGGCGRSGMVLLKLMVEMGEPAEAALQRLRTQRPCAVETDAQRQWGASTSR